MEIEYKGANTLIIKQGANATVAINPKLSVYGLKDVKVADTVEIVHESQYEIDSDQKILIKGPGEYEVSDVSIKGISAQKYGSPEDKVTIYRLEVAGVRIAVLGDINPKLDESQLENIGVIDIVALPIGGNSITLNAHEAAKIVNQIDPRVVIPMHYKDSSVKYSVEQEDVEGFLKELGAQEYEETEKLKIKNAALPATRTVYKIKRSN